MNFGKILYFRMDIVESEKICSKIRREVVHNKCRKENGIISVSIKKDV